ncbi:MAG: DUF2304 domain-containing protein [Candidatus Komeilibacteria bacterium]
MLIQIIVSFFVILVWLTIWRRPAGRLSQGQSWTWTLLWLLILLVFWWPDATTYIANYLGIGRGADLVVYLAIIALFYWQFRLYLGQQKIAGQITQLVRREALEQADRSTVNKED